MPSEDNRHHSGQSIPMNGTHHNYRGKKLRPTNMIDFQNFQVMQYSEVTLYISFEMLKNSKSQMKVFQFSEQSNLQKGNAITIRLPKVA